MAKSTPQASTKAAKRISRLYMASLSDYNAGRLHGAWIEATDIQQVREAVAAMLKASPVGRAEEYAIHDFKGFSRYLPSEFADLELVCAIGAAIVEHCTVFTAYCEHFGFPPETNSAAKLVAGFTESYRGAYASLEDWGVISQTVLCIVQVANAGGPVAICLWGERLQVRSTEP
jgi:antirestriction protein